MPLEFGRLPSRTELSVGAVEVDETHKELFGLYNRVAWACEHASSVASIREAVRSFVLYARWHFAEEEASMLNLHFPGYVAHKADHERLLQDATDFIDNFEGALGLKDSLAVAQYFRYWLMRHMADKDQQFREFLGRSHATAVAFLIGCLTGC